MILLDWACPPLDIVALCGIFSFVESPENPRSISETLYRDSNITSVVAALIMPSLSILSDCWSFPVDRLAFSGSVLSVIMVL
jgi:hypothetical protein